MLGSEFFNDISRNKRNFIDKMSIKPKKRPKTRIDSKSNMLPFSIRESIKRMINPDISSFFTARRTESRFTRMRDFFRVKTDRTNNKMVSEKRGFTREHFKNINDDSISDKIAMF